jgi:beta-1,4-mannosyltransferase
MIKKIFIYPITKEILKKENNDYIKKLTSYLNINYTIINHATDIGLLDALLKFRKADIYYFNWIENLPEKRFGILQTALLVLLLILCKIFDKKVVWFIHNNISHNKKYLQLKKIIVKLMSLFADLIFSHSAEIKFKLPNQKLHIFHHPIKNFNPLVTTNPYEYDLLIWGTIQPYKGISEFVDFASNSKVLNSKKILIAGNFKSNDYYENILRKKNINISIENRFITEEELICLFKQSKYILFTYTSDSILSSAALCKSLSYGKEVIAPNIGSFMELGKENLIYTYSSFKELETLLQALSEPKKMIDKNKLNNYIQETSWSAFTSFLIDQINALYLKSTINPIKEHNS